MLINYLKTRYLEYDVEQLVNDLVNLIYDKGQDAFYIRVNKSLNYIQVIIEINIYEHLDKKYNDQNESKSY